MSDAKVRPAHWSDVRVAVFLFVALWLTYGFFVGDFNSASVLTRMSLIFSFIDPNALPAADVAFLAVDRARDGLLINTDMAPGLSFTALPSVAVLLWAARALHFAAQPIADGKLTSFYAVATAIAAFSTGGLFTAAAAAMAYRLARHWRVSRSSAFYGTLGFALASPALGWAGVFYPHATAGACLLIAFACIVLGTERKPNPRQDVRDGLVVGLLLAWAATIEPTAALAAALIAAFGIWALIGMAGGRAPIIAGAAVIGGIAGLVPTMIYNAVTFGSVFHIAFESAVGVSGAPEGATLSWPNPLRLYGLLFGGFRGLLWVAPLLILAPLGYWASFRRLSRPVWILMLGLPVAYLVLICGYAYAWGGWSTGPRFLVPTLAFLILPLAFLWQRAGEGARLALAGIAIVGLGDALACASVSMITPQPYPNPMLDYILPLFVGGYIRNALTLAGLQGFVTLAAVPVLWLAVAAAMIALARRGVPSAVGAAGPGEAAQHTRPEQGSRKQATIRGR